MNFTWTLYYGEAEFGGSSKAYALDLNKEFANRSFYDIGMAYSPNDKAWDLHGSVILMVTKNQGVEFGYEHYTFNDTNVADLGWRIYW